MSGYRLRLQSFLKGNMQPASHQSCQQRVVVADDDPWFRALLVKTVARAGGVLLGAAQDGEEALRLCRALQPDWLLTDYSMPKLNGLELVEYLNQEPFEMRVVALSQDGDGTVKSAFLAAGVFRFIHKNDLKQDDLFHLLEEQLRLK